MSSQKGPLRIPSIRPKLHATLNPASKSERKMEEILSEFLAVEDKLRYAARLPVNELAKLVMILSDAYYNNEALVDDQLFDDIQQVLALIDPNNEALRKIGAPIPESLAEGSELGFESFKVEDYPEISRRGVTFTNPNYRVKVTLPFLMPSMDKIKTNDYAEYANWLSKMSKYGDRYNISDKLDGMSVALTYNFSSNGELKTQLFSRGDGQIGEDLSAIIPFLRLPDPPEGLIRANGHLYLRGEVIISKETFQREFGTEPMAMRNIARGIMGRKTLNSAFLELLDLVIYELVSPWNSESITEGLNLLSNLGYNVVWNQLVIPAPTLEELQQLLIIRKKESPYQLDGLIISQDHVPSRDIKPGDKYPSYAIAFKFGSDTEEIESALTIVGFVTWNKSKDGKLNPVATIKPVGLGGTRVEHVTVHNARHVVDMGIGPDAIIRVTRGGDVIPHIVSSLRPVEPQMPDIPYQWNQTNKQISILNPEEDEDVLLARSEYFFKKLKVPGWGPATVQKIVKKNWPAPTGIHEILDMSIEDLAEIPGHRGKIASNLYTNLHQKLRNVNLPQLMAATNIFGSGWGEQRFQTILESIPDLLEEPFRTESDRQRLLQKIISVPGFQKTTAIPLVEGLAPFIAFLYGIYRLGWIGIYRTDPIPRPYIFPSDKYRINSELDAIWDDLQAIGYAKKDYTDEEYEKASILQEKMFEEINNDLAKYVQQIEEEESKQISTSTTGTTAKTATTTSAKVTTPGKTATAMSSTTSLRATPRLPIVRPSSVKSIPKPIEVPKPIQVQKPSLLGKTIVFTGIHAGIEDRVSMLGAKVTGSVTGNTDILVIKDPSFTSAKVTKARNIGTKIMTLDEFVQTYL